MTRSELLGHQIAEELRRATAAAEGARVSQSGFTDLVGQEGPPGEPTDPGQETAPEGPDVTQEEDKDERDREEEEKGAAQEEEKPEVRRSLVGKQKPPWKLVAEGQAR